MLDDLENKLSIIPSPHDELQLLKRHGAQMSKDEYDKRLERLQEFVKRESWGMPVPLTNPSGRLLPDGLPMFMRDKVALIRITRSDTSTPELLIETDGSHLYHDKKLVQGWPKFDWWYSRQRYVEDAQAFITRLAGIQIIMLDLDVLSERNVRRLIYSYLWDWKAIEEHLVIPYNAGGRGN